MAANDEGKYTFSALGISGSLQEGLKKNGVIAPSRHQYNAIKAILDRQDLILQSKSGTGKTLSFCIAVLHLVYQDDSSTNPDNDDSCVSETLESTSVRCLSPKHSSLDIEQNDLENMDISSVDEMEADITSATEINPLGQHTKNISIHDGISFGQVVVIVPTRELAAQICKTLTQILDGSTLIRLHLIVGGARLDEGIADLINSAPQIIVATPGRLITTMSRGIKCTETQQRHTIMRYMNTQTLVLDEADMLLDEHFIGQIKTICTNMVNPFVQIIATSATFIKAQFKLYEDMIMKQDEDFLNRVASYFSMDTYGKIESLKKAFGIHVTRKIYRLLNGHIETPNSGDGIIDDPVSKFPEELNQADNIKYTSLLKRVILPKRNIVKMIVSASHVSRMEVSKNVVCFTENDCIPDYKGLRTAIEQKESLVEQSDTPVLKNVQFFYVEVFEAPNIVKQIALKLRVVVKLLEDPRYIKTIIFCNQSHTRMLTANVLERLGISCSLCSSRQPVNSRKVIIDEFIKSGTSVMIAADVISRGINIDNVDLVVNMDVPESKEAFLHRSGRTGRYGGYGHCVSICTKPEMETLAYLEYALNFKCKQMTDVGITEYVGARSRRTTDESDSETPECSYENDSKAADVNNDCDHSSIISSCAQKTNVVTRNKSQTFLGSSQQGFNEAIRSPIISSIHSCLFPGLKECILPAYAVLLEHDLYLEGVAPIGIISPECGTVDPPGSENTFRVKFVELRMSKVTLHLSLDFYDAIVDCDQEEETYGKLHHILAVQDGGGGISILDPIHHIFKPICGTLLISVVSTKDTLIQLSELMSMVNVDVLLHHHNDMSELAVPFVEIYDDLMYYPPKLECKSELSLLVDLFRNMFQSERDEDALAHVDVVVNYFIQHVTAGTPSPVILAYQLVSQKLYAMGIGLMDTSISSGVSYSRRTRNIHGSSERNNTTEKSI
ncbi:DEAD/DEAH box helicase family protein [Babesia bovis T2Bo]|uniref:DEAD/DEAH box helicase domain containing protein n=1 Tax=Babesia bovis TaxID=5865 RepID=A7APA3_BABBO|nr:DEAD/DEAH box helicase family protein [Babesia bovis T2Bo]EDO08387.1 DEAD/DEAH box helicase family protein [Babesia bovis T2Bo]|eukprot:XP_001611955.1 DEAD/DEAH box helicase domain containing protein [Babesia bovis T2Bo]